MNSINLKFNLLWNQMEDFMAWWLRLSISVKNQNRKCQSFWHDKIRVLSTQKHGNVNKCQSLSVFPPLKMHSWDLFFEKSDPKNPDIFSILKSWTLKYFTDPKNASVVRTCTHFECHFFRVSIFDIFWVVDISWPKNGKMSKKMSLTEMLTLIPSWV